MEIGLVRPQDEPEVRRLLRENPMAGDIRLTLEREPDSSLAATVEGEVHQVVAARKGGSPRLVAMGTRSVRTCWVDGLPRRLGYLSQLRLDRDGRGRPALLRRGYQRLKELRREGEAPFDITTILADNYPARRLLEAGLPDLPTYRLLEPFVTLVLPAKGRRRHRRDAVERGDASSLAQIVACLERWGRRHQFAPRWTEADLLSPERTRDLQPGDFYLVRRDGEVIGCLALWDQRRFKQTVVRGYSRRLALARPLINLLEPWLRTPRLPPVGDPLRIAFLSHLAVDGDDPGVLLSLLEAAREDARRGPWDYLTLGLADRHPLRPVVQQAFPCREYTSLLYLVHWVEGATAAAAVGGRIPHLEVAVL